MNPLKVIVLYNKLFHYRIPVWNILAEMCDLTVAYTDGDSLITDGTDCKFDIIHLPAIKLFRKFVIHKDSIRKIVKNYDAVIAYGDIAWVKYSTLPWFSKTKVVFHSLGVSASYDKGYDSHHEWDRMRKFFYNRANALAFYTSFPIEKYAKMGIPREKMFEAPNTVEVHPVEAALEKDSILFIGTLYRQKGIQLILDAYLELRGKVDLPIFRIIGKGPDYESIRLWIDEHKMEDLIEMTGGIYNIDEKARYFSKAYACISPKQAGLSVLESMGYGVPFISCKGAITGGELTNVHNGVDGVIVEDDSRIIDVIRDIAINKEKYVEMGRRAQEFYKGNRTPRHMANGLWNAVKYAIEN